jgi:LDH2 family malate/lactate/ureidoglycolate dehydrogenase
MPKTSFTWSPADIAEKIPAEISTPYKITIPKGQNNFRIPQAVHKYFVYKTLLAINVRPEFAALAAEKLADNDKWGISTHGINRLYEIYLKKIQQGIINPNALPTVKIDHSQALVDAHHGLGFVASHYASSLAMTIAETYGSSFVSVKNSNHFGTGRNWVTLMASGGKYYAECGTNARPSVAMVNSALPMIGTNPIAAAVELSPGIFFCPDCATASKHNGNTEKYVKMGIPLPEGYIYDMQGQPILNAVQALKQVRERTAFNTPVGGLNESKGGHGHKGTCFALNEETKSLLSTGPSSLGTSGRDQNNQPIPHELSHYFRCTKLETTFRSAADYLKNLNKLLTQIQNSPKLPGTDRVYYPGQKEYLAEQDSLKNGIPIDQSMVSTIQQIQDELGLTILKF